MRQPLSRVLVKPGSNEDGALLEQVTAQIVDELNVKEVGIIDREEDVLDFQGEAEHGDSGLQVRRGGPEDWRRLGGLDPVAVALRARGGSTVEVGDYVLQRRR